ncbi:MAG: hypothetical protein KDE32_13090 [Novosphingobium sp.]|nr:hypothetical protein [Novosphingobium sp.]
MKRIAVALALVAAVSAAAPDGTAKDRRSIPGRQAANPSALVAAEIAFNRMAQDQGHWTAFRKFAAEDAVMFVPEPVSAQEWLKGRADPPKSVVWQPHEVWMSCDGTLGATRGAWQRSDGSTGYFTTVWKRQKDGSYKWVLDQGDALEAPLGTSDMISASVAECGSPAPRAIEIEDSVRVHVDQEGGAASNDGTLAYRYDSRSGTSRTFVVTMRRDGKMLEVIRSVVTNGK